MPDWKSVQRALGNVAETPYKGSTTQSGGAGSGDTAWEACTREESCTGAAQKVEGGWSSGAAESHALLQRASARAWVLGSARFW